MARRRARDVTVGTVFALSLVILAFAIMAVGGESGVFFAKTSYRATFPAADGLLVGAPVRMNGVNIGTVSAIRLPTDPGETGIQVRLSVDPTYAPRVRADSRAALRILQFLTSEKFVEIIPGSLDSPLLDAGAEIPRLVEAGVFERGEAIADNLSSITISLSNILGPMERGEGLIGKMLHDPEFGVKGIESLGGTLGNLEQLTDDLMHAEGTAGRLLRDPELASRLDDVSAAIASLTSIVQAVERGEGALGALLADDGTTDQVLADLGEAAASLKRTAARLEDPDGLLGRVLYDSEFSDRLADDLSTTLANLVEITDKINRGEGTLGALLNDRELYDGAEVVVAGVEDSKFARWLLRHYRKRGVKAQERTPDTDEGP